LDQQFSEKDESEGLPSNFPVISNIKSVESACEVSDLPELTQTYSSIRRTKTFDFDLLFIKLYKKHSQYLLQEIYQDSQKQILKKGVNYLCKKAPWILTLSQKQAILRYRLFFINHSNLIGKKFNKMSWKPLPIMHSLVSQLREKISLIQQSANFQKKLSKSFDKIFLSLSVENKDMMQVFFLLLLCSHLSPRWAKSRIFNHYSQRIVWWKIWTFHSNSKHF